MSHFVCNWDSLLSHSEWESFTYYQKSFQLNKWTFLSIEWFKLCLSQRIFQFNLFNDSVFESVNPSLTWYWYWYWYHWSSESFANEWNELLILLRRSVFCISKTFAHDQGSFFFLIQWVSWISESFHQDRDSSGQCFEIMNHLVMTKIPFCRIHEKDSFLFYATVSVWVSRFFLVVTCSSFSESIGWTIVQRDPFWAQSVWAGDFQDFSRWNNNLYWVLICVKREREVVHAVLQS